MIFRVAVLVCLFCYGVFAQPLSPTDDVRRLTKNPVVQVETNKGDFFIELYSLEAKETVANFLAYVEDGYYAGTLFHRVIDGFIIQGGGFEPGLKAKPFKKPIKNTSKDGLSNTKYTVAMALTTDINSATSQFFINMDDNLFLDYDSRRLMGYTVFGKVIEGVKVLHEIQKEKTYNVEVFSDIYKRPVVLRNVPERDVVIEGMKVLRKEN